MEEVSIRKTWYFVTPRNKLHDFVNLLHLPYTFMVLSYVAIGSFLSPSVHYDRTLATVIAYFLGLGIGVHCIDQLEPKGSRYVRYLKRRELILIATVSILTAVGVGVYYARLSAWIYLIIAIELFFSLAYPLPTYLFRGLFHNRLSFAFSWGYLPFLCGYFVNSLSINFFILIAGLPIATSAWLELTFSRKSRNARKLGLEHDYQTEEKKLKLLVTCVYATSLALIAVRQLAFLQ